MTAGRIGTAYARMMVEGHKMDLVYYDRHGNDELERYVADYAAFLAARGEEPVQYRRAASLGDLLGSSDVVSIHATLTDETHHLIGAKELDMMKPTAFLINTARGQIVDQDALIDALRGKKIGGAGLDVYKG